MKSIIVLLIISLSINVWAAREPQSTVQDTRVRVVSYSPKDIVKITLHHGITTGIRFEESEVFENSFTGLESALQVTPKKPDLIAIKPLVPYADTNLTIITNKRTYLLEVKIRNPKETEYGLNDISDKNLTYQLFFTYPEEQHKKDVANYQHQINRERQSHLEACNTQERVDPETLNFGYKMSGSKKIAPMVVFDDGRFTYLKFHHDTPIPSVFTVDAENYEMVVNKKMHGDTLIVQETASRFTLRRAKQVLTIRSDHSKVPNNQSTQETRSGGGYAGW